DFKASGSLGARPSRFATRSFGAHALSRMQGTRTGTTPCSAMRSQSSFERFARSRRRSRRALDSALGADAVGVGFGLPPGRSPIRVSRRSHSWSDAVRLALAFSRLLSSFGSAVTDATGLGGRAGGKAVQAPLATTAPEKKAAPPIIQGFAIGRRYQRPVDR